MNIIKEFIRKQNVFIVDGALGTQIQKNGYDVSDYLWSAKYLYKNPEVIKEVHKQYLDAGADCIITSTYQGSIEGFLKKGFSCEEAVKLLELSVIIAKEVRDDFWQNCSKTNRIKPLVAASIAPYGAHLSDGSEYSGNYNISDEKLKIFHKNRLKIIINTNPDILAIETIPSLKEAKIIVEVLNDLKNSIPAWLSFSAKNETSTNANDDIKDCAKYLNTQSQIQAVGINCTAPQYISSLIKNIKKYTSKDIIVYPNGGSKYNPLTKIWEKGEISAKEYSKMAYLWYQNGAKLIGGCCETTPEEIKEIRKLFTS